MFPKTCGTARTNSSRFRRLKLNTVATPQVYLANNRTNSQVYEHYVHDEYAGDAAIDDFAGSHTPPSVVEPHHPTPEEQVYLVDHDPVPGI